MMRKSIRNTRVKMVPKCLPLNELSNIAKDPRFNTDSLLSIVFEPPHHKASKLNMQNQRRRSAVQ